MARFYKSLIVAALAMCAFMIALPPHHPIVPVIAVCATGLSAGLIYFSGTVK